MASLELTILAVIWLAVGVLTGVMAGRQGRNAPVWLIMGAMFSVAALVVLMLIPPSTQQAASSVGLGRRGFRQCPRCAEPIRLEAAKCRYCLSSIDPAEPTSPTVPSDDDNPLDGKAGEYLAVGMGVAIAVGGVIFMISRWPT